MVGNKKSIPSASDIIEDIDITISDIKVEEIELPKFDDFELKPMEMPDLTEIVGNIDNPSEQQAPRQPNATAKQVAAWLKEQMKDGEYMYQEQIVYDVIEEFGENHVFTNENGNWGIKKSVLDEFRKITPDVVWSRSERYWRKREPGDDPKKRQVDY